MDKYIQAVRRGRRIEKALEGSRLQDILRWAAADILIIGKTPTGALFKGSSLETAYGESLQEGENLFLTGTPSDSKRYIIPFNNKHYPNDGNSIRNEIIYYPYNLVCYRLQVTNGSKTPVGNLLDYRI